MPARLRSDILVTAILRAVNGANGFGVVARRGHDEGGIIHLVIRTRSGVSVLSETQDGAGELAWRCRLGAATDEEANVLLEKERRFDPDIWVLDLEGDELIETLPGTVIER